MKRSPGSPTGGWAKEGRKRNMDWFEKEAAYERTYAAGKQAKAISRYIPDKWWKAINGCSIESDGYWIYLNEGYTAYDHGEDCGIIHEYNIADLKAAIKTIKYTNGK